MVSVSCKESDAGGSVSFSQETPHAAVERWLGRPDLREMLVGEGAFLALE
jgi:hypothetical protein